MDLTPIEIESMSNASTKGNVDIWTRPEINALPAAKSIPRFSIWSNAP